MTAVTRLTNARTALVLDHPFFGSLALRLTFKEAGPNVTTTLATDGRSIFYSRKYVEGATEEALLADVAHEVLHLALGHHVRRDNREPKRWNYAADYAENPILKDAGFAVGADWLMNPSYSGQSAEAIYDLLTPEPQPEEEEHGGDSRDDQGDDTGSGAGEDDSGDEDSQDGGDSQGDDGQPGDDQSTRQGQPRPGGDNGVADVPGAVLDAPDPTSDAAEWEVAVIQAAQAATMMGNLPGSLAQAIEEATRARTDWKAVLRRFVQQIAAADYSWRMPNRRYMAGGLYLPELRSESMPPLVLVLDSSASTMQWQAMFVDEINSVAAEVMPEKIFVMHVDAAVHRVDEFERGEPVHIPQVLGQGGTDFRPAFAYLDREGIQPAAIIYLTDGDGTYPNVPYDVPTLWMMTADMVAPWGETVRLEV